jgi:putative chitinase
MCLKASVGQHGHNFKADVITVKVMMNSAWKQRGGPAMPINGRVDRALLTRIRFFQERYLKLQDVPWRIEPRSRSLALLRRLMPHELDDAKLAAIMPHATQALINRYYKHLVTEMALRSINTPLRRAHFLAQLAHESGSLVYAEELASGEAYEGRVKNLGNTEKGDGKRFKGRGLIQLTGRANYKAYGDDIGVDLTKDGAWTTVATNPVLAVGAAGWFWQVKGLNAVADSDDVREVTRIVNGGANGLEDRMRYLYRARYFLFA